ncbi:hypothetical protein LOB98_02895, partial [Lactobacillus delbrueckii subsp. lactis]|nr:hypothetical protein [Lactobacillus delbrueckii subsp. lactis]
VKLPVLFTTSCVQRAHGIGFISTLHSKRKSVERLLRRVIIQHQISMFYCMVDELADITFNHSLQIMVEAMFESVKEIFQPTEELMGRFTNAFISRLPKYMQEAVSPSLAA